MIDFCLDYQSNRAPLPLKGVFRNVQRACYR